MTLVSLTLLGLTFEIRLGQGSGEDTPSPHHGLDGTLHEVSPSSSPPPLLGFSLPSTRDPWPGWEE